VLVSCVVCGGEGDDEEAPVAGMEWRGRVDGIPTGSKHELGCVTELIWVGIISSYQH